MREVVYVTNTSDKSKAAAFFLCLIGGLFGLHYFYVGRVMRGILAAFTLDFFVFGWILDMMQILLGNFKDNTGAPLRR